MVLDKILKWILTNSALPDNGEIVELLSQEFIESLFPHQRLLKSLDRQLLITPNVCPIGKPQYGSASLLIDLRSDIKINYKTKTNHRILLFKNLNKDPPNSNVPIQSKQLNSSSCYSFTLSPSEDIDCGSFTSHNPTQRAVSNTLQYQDQQKYDNRCTQSFMTKNQQQFRSLFRSPTDNYHETQNRNRNRSHSRSCNEQRRKSKSTDSLEKKQESRDRMRRKSRSKSRTKSPKRKENVTKYPPLSKPNDHSPYIPSKSDFVSTLPLSKGQRNKRNKSYRKLQDKLLDIKEKMTSNRAGFHKAAFSSISRTTTIKEIESDSEIEKIHGNIQQTLIPVKPYYQNPDEVLKIYHPRTVFVLRPPLPYFMPPRLRLRYPPLPPIMYRPQ